jgi:hypothetical protein
MNIIVLGYIVRGPIGGLAWHHLQYVIGLANMGHNVYFFEDSDDYPSCYDPDRHVTDTNPGYGLEFAAAAFKRVGLGDKWAYHDAHTGKWYGPIGGSGPALCRSADLLLNISGVNPLRSWFLDIPERALIDTDPVFTQVRHLSDPSARSLAGRHTAFFTFGENTGSGNSSIPSDDFPWMPTRQPIVLDAWPFTAGPDDGVFTTVMQWDSYKPAQHDGNRYGMKSESFIPYLDLPAHTQAKLELCLGSPNAPRDLLLDKGWLLSDALEITRTPWTYQQYIRSSKGEFTVAKQGYVVSRSGWFSERSAAYLASGRPVVTQETGFSEWLDTGDGVLAFNDPVEAADCLADVSSRYRHHCRAARDVAEDYFDSRKVLQKLLDDIFSQRQAGDCPE